MKNPHQVKAPDKTYLDSNQPHIFGPFFAGYLDLLRKKLSQGNLGDVVDLLD